jgi:hypothetical protein
MRSFTLLIGSFFGLAALGPALGQAIDGKTPKGIAYRYERMNTGEKAAVYFAWRYSLNDEARIRASSITSFLG